MEIKKLKATQKAVKLAKGESLVIREFDGDDPVEIEYITARGTRIYVVWPDAEHPLKRLSISGANMLGDVRFRKYVPPVVDVGELPILDK